jgi:hypothetical protein
MHKINPGCDVKEQHGQSEIRAVTIHQLSWSGMRLIKLLHHVLVREEQWRQVHVNLLPKSQRKEKILKPGTSSEK